MNTPDIDLVGQLGKLPSFTGCLITDDIQASGIRIKPISSAIAKRIWACAWLGE